MGWVKKAEGVPYIVYVLLEDDRPIACMGHMGRKPNIEDFLADDGLPVVIEKDREYWIKEVPYTV
jgi:hypothetical protein